MVVLWRATGKNAGIVAVGTLASEPQSKPAEYQHARFVLHPDEATGLASQVLVKVAATPFIDKKTIRALDAMVAQQILSAPMGTVFPLSAAQSVAPAGSWWSRRSSVLSRQLWGAPHERGQLARVASRGNSASAVITAHRVAYSTKAQRVAMRYMSSTVLARLFNSSSVHTR